MEFVAYGQDFKIAYGDTVKDALEIIHERTGRNGGFRRVIDGIDLRRSYAFLNNEQYQFIEDVPPQQQGRDEREGGDSSVSSQFKVQMKCGKSLRSFLLDNVNLKSLRELVIHTWEIFQIREFHLELDEVIIDEDLLAQRLLGCKKFKKPTELAFTIVSDCNGFSDYKKENDYLLLENMTKVEDADVEYGTSNIDEQKWKSQIDHAVMDLMNKKTLYGPITKNCETTVREYMSPVLSLAALIAENIMMKAEEKVCGLRGNGPVDYLFLYKRFSVVVTEVKNEDFESGIAQNDAQMVAGRQEYKRNLQINLPEFKEKSRKRKYLEIDISSIPSFGVVSSGEQYLFQKLIEGAEGTTIHKSKVFSINLLNGTEDEMKQRMLKVVKVIVWILTIQKEKIDEHPVTKRVRHQF